jgi:hypothetical protein
MFLILYGGERAVGIPPTAQFEVDDQVRVVDGKFVTDSTGYVFEWWLKVFFDNKEYFIDRFDSEEEAKQALLRLVSSLNERGSSCLK